MSQSDSSPPPAPDPAPDPAPSKMAAETEVVVLDSAQLFTKTWIPSITPIAVLLFIHGFSEYIERYDHVFSVFAERGIKTLAWDQRGFGRSATKKSDWGKTKGTKKALEDIDYFVKLAKEQAEIANVPLFLWGHSMGGELALIYAGHGPEKECFRGVISQSPLIKLVKPPARPLFFLMSIISKILPNLKLYSPVLGKFISRDPEMAKKYDEDPLVHGTGTFLGLYTMLKDGEDLLSHPPPIDVPLLVQHGTDDKVTSYEATKQLFDKLPPGNEDRTFKTWEGYYHELHNEPEDERNETIKYIAEWILARCKGPSTPRARL